MARKCKTMPTNPLNVVIQHLLAHLRLKGEELTDAELLARYLSSRCDDALAALVRRHAPMVWGVCSRLLHSHHDAEDAFQATFLVLVSKAASVPRQAVANWLYGVARQTAVRLRATAAKQRRRETQVVNMPEPTVAEVRDADLQAVLDEELSRLPNHYRGVIVLCELEGMTRKEAARQLAIPEGSVASRLARARVMLAKRLTQRGIVLSGGALAAVLPVGSASASVPPALVASTVEAASLLAAGQAAGVISVKVAALIQGVLKAMFMTKIKSLLAMVLVVLLIVGIGVGGLSTNPVAVAQKPEAKIIKTQWEYASLIVDDAAVGINWHTGKTTINVPGDVRKLDFDRNVKELYRKLGGKDENPTLGLLLNLLGQDGWEMVSYGHPTGAQVWTFKRPSQ